MKTTIRRKTVRTPAHFGRAHTQRTEFCGTVPRSAVRAHSGLSLIACMLAVLAALSAGHPADAREGSPRYGVSVAVLPFEVFSIAKEPSLGTDVASSVARQLALNPSITCVDSGKIQSVLQPDDYGAMTADRLRQIAKLLNANCIVMGTITKIRSEHSIDVEMFTTAAAGPNFKTFAEGLDIQSLVETIVNALDQRIMNAAEQIPTPERPQVSAARQASTGTRTGGYDVERELLAAFGPPQSTPPAAGSEPQTLPVPAQAGKPDDAAPAADDKASADAPEAPAPDVSEKAPQAESEKKKNRRSKGTADPGFFSLSKAISINSDTMEYDNRANMAVFNGNVVARQDDIVMFANTMNVFYSENGGLTRVEAKGDVRVVQGDRVATGSSIVFDNATQTIVATGNPRVWQGDNVVHGRKITVFLKEERTVVESEPNSRASATIYPDSDKKRP